MSLSSLIIISKPYIESWFCFIHTVFMVEFGETREFKRLFCFDLIRLLNISYTIYVLRIAKFHRTLLKVWKKNNLSETSLEIIFFNDDIFQLVNKLSSDSSKWKQTNQHNGFRYVFVHCTYTFISIFLHYFEHSFVQYHVESWSGSLNSSHIRHAQY